jgi:transglutaminase-like putative cysteine protease/tetratricopeptide (TPR) repeat protein
VLALALGPACASTGVVGAADVRVVASEPSPDVDALVSEFFGPGPAAGFEARLRGALASRPTSGPLHEVAGYWDLLGGEDHRSWEHFLRAAADTHNAGAALDIWEVARVNRTASEMVATVDTLDRVAHAHPDADVRARATYTRAGYLRLLGRLDEAKRAVAELGYIPSVRVIGAFNNEDGKGFTEAYPPESRVDLDATLAGLVVPVRWRLADALAAQGQIPLHELVYPNSGAVAYVAVWVDVPSPTDATLRISTDVPVAAWVDHTLAVREDRVRHWDLDNVKASIVLPAGRSEILVKSAVKTGAWSMALRMTDRSGRPLPGLVTSVVPGPSSIASAASVVPEPPVAGTEPGNPRAAFAAARGLVGNGLNQAGLAVLEKLLAAAPGSPLLRYVTADAAERDQQTERALDLLSSAISDTDAQPAFLDARAILYLGKGLLNQALRDVSRAVEHAPDARLARMDLADVYARRNWQADRQAVLGTVVARWPDSAWAHTSLASALEASRYVDRARHAYERAAELEPGNVVALRALRRLAETREDPREAQIAYERLAQIQPGDEGDELAHADYDRALGRVDAASARLQRLSGRSPDLPTPYIRRAQIAEELGRASEAIALYQTAQERDPRDSWLAERLQHLKPPAQDALTKYIVSDDAIDEAAQRAAARGDPASHVETILFEEATLLNADGSVRLVHTEVVRALTQRGRDELVHLGLPYGGQVRVLKAFAQTPAGKRQDASSVEPSSVRFRNLEVGSTVVLQYAFYPVRNGAFSDDYFSDWTFSRLARHIDRMRWVLVAPKDKALYVDADPRVSHVVTQAQGWTVHEFFRQDVPAVPAEPSMVPIADWQAHVVVTTLTSWDSFIRWEKALLDESFPADPQIDQLAARLTAGATTPREKLSKLFAFVAQEVRYQQEYESIVAGWKPHRSSVVLERKYGDCKDKSTLLIALARAEGLKVHFAVLATHRAGHPSRKVVLPAFDHAVAYVPVQPGIDEALFLDATVDALDLWNVRDDDQGATALVLDPVGGQWRWIEIPYQPPSFQLDRWNAEVDVESPEKALAKAHLEIRGSRASLLRAVLRNEDQSRQLYEYVASSAFPGAKVISASAPDHESIVQPLRVIEEIDVGPSIRREGDHYRLKFSDEVETARTKLNERQTPLDLGPPRASSSEVVVRLGKGVRLTDKPAAVDVVDPCFHVRRAVSGDRASVILKDDFEQTCTRVSVEDYPRYRANMERARSLLDAAVVFDRAK